MCLLKSTVLCTEREHWQQPQSATIMGHNFGKIFTGFLFLETHFLVLAKTGYQCNLSLLFCGSESDVGYRYMQVKTYIDKGSVFFHETLFANIVPQNHSLKVEGCMVSRPNILIIKSWVNISKRTSFIMKRTYYSVLKIMLGFLVLHWLLLQSTTSTTNATTTL